MVCVAPGLFLGNKQAAADRELLRSKGVVAVCAVGARQVFNDDLRYHHVSIEDDGSHSMLPHFIPACNFIHEQRARGAVLVHCKGGISRSPTMIVAYLMRHEQLSLVEAFEVCSLARPAARPRQNFLQDLEHFAAALQDDAADRDEAQRWDRAVALANEEDAVTALGCREVTSRQEVQAECHRLLKTLQNRCIVEAFGEPKEPSSELQEAARSAVTSYAKKHGWTKLRDDTNDGLSTGGDAHTPL